MRIRWKLTFQFASMVAILLLLLSVSIYYFSADYRYKHFTSRLRERALNTEKLLIEVKEVDSTLLKIIDKNTRRLFEERILIYDEKNSELYDNGVIDTATYNASFLQKIRTVGELEFNQGVREAIGESFIFNGKKNVVIASAYDKIGKDKLTNLRFILLIAFFAGVALAIGGGITYSSAALKPISAVIHQVNNISATNLHMRVDEGNKLDEIAQLGMTFNNMLSRLETSFEMQRRFVSHVSHELRTPLTYMLGEIELMQMTEHEQTEYQNFLKVLSLDIKETNNLLNNLLILGKASLDISLIKFESVRLDELLLTSRIESLKNNPEYSIIIKFEDFPEDLEGLRMMANEKLLKVALMNLMDNGCKFSPNHQVEVLLKADLNEFFIRFTDAGIGIKEEDLNRILNEPFYRGENARVIKGNGIGLTLTSRIIAFHDGSVDIVSKLSAGSIFTVHLPRNFVAG